MRWNNSSRVIPAPGFIEPSLPTNAAKAPQGPLWIHEIKHDGYRLLVSKRGDTVRIYTRRGADWTARFPRIIEAARKVRARSFYLDGEGVVCGNDGVAIFDRLHSKAADDLVFLYAFDLLELDGVDLRQSPLEQRKNRLRTLLRNRRSGIVYNDYVEGDGAVIFKHAFGLGLEGISPSAATWATVRAESRAGSRSRIRKALLCRELMRGRSERSCD